MMCSETSSMSAGEHDGDRVLSTASIVQLLTGHVISDASGTVQCLGCEALLDVGDIVCAVGVRWVEHAEWVVPRLYCWGCGPARVRSPTLGAAEAVVYGRVGLRVDPTTRTHLRCLTELSLRAYSSPDAS